MPPIDTTNVSFHFLNDRKYRLHQIEAVGWGVPIASQRSGDAIETLTSTGVMVIRSFENTIITAYFAEIDQAIAIFRKTYGKVRLPQDIYDIIIRNNIMFPAV